MIDVLYEDRSLIVCLKPVGVLSQCDGQRDMVCLLREQCGGDIYPLHRLDRESGGVMVFARDARTAAALSAQIQRGEFVKRYLAAVEGIPQPSEGEMRDLLFKDSRRNKSFVVNRPRKGTKEARLAYETLSAARVNGADSSLVKVRLYTGRTHQIRVQFASRQMPLLGDGKYGSRDRGCTVALWSHSLTFVHPVSGEERIFISCPDGNAYPWHFFENIPVVPDGKEQDVHEASKNL